MSKPSKPPIQHPLGGPKGLPGQPRNVAAATLRGSAPTFYPSPWATQQGIQGSSYSGFPSSSFAAPNAMAPHDTRYASGYAQTQGAYCAVTTAITTQPNVTNVIGYSTAAPQYLSSGMTQMPQASSQASPNDLVTKKPNPRTTDSWRAPAPQQHTQNTSWRPSIAYSDPRIIPTYMGNTRRMTQEDHQPKPDNTSQEHQQLVQQEAEVAVTATHKVERQQDQPLAVEQDPDTRTPSNYVIINITTDSSYGKSSIIEFGAIVVDPLHFSEISSFSTLIGNAEVSPDSLKQHGLHPEILSKAPVFDEVASQIFKMLNGNCWVGHDLKRDLPKISHAFSACGHQLPTNSGTMDTRDWIARGFGSARAGNLQLSSLTRYFGIRNYSGRSIDQCQLLLRY